MNSLRCGIVVLGILLVGLVVIAYSYLTVYHGRQAFVVCNNNVGSIDRVSFRIVSPSASEKPDALQEIPPGECAETAFRAPDGASVEIAIFQAGREIWDEEVYIISTPVERRSVLFVTKSGQVFYPASRAYVLGIPLAALARQ